MSNYETIISEVIPICFAEEITKQDKQELLKDNYFFMSNGIIYIQLLNKVGNHV